MSPDQYDPECLPWSYRIAGDLIVVEDRRRRVVCRIDRSGPHGDRDMEPVAAFLVERANASRGVADER
jgi:hypothetical protein